MLMPNEMDELREELREAHQHLLCLCGPEPKILPDLLKKNFVELRYDVEDKRSVFNENAEISITFLYQIHFLLKKKEVTDLMSRVIVPLTLDEVITELKKIKEKSEKYISLLGKIAIQDIQILEFLEGYITIFAEKDRWLNLLEQYWRVLASLEKKENFEQDREEFFKTQLELLVRLLRIERDLERCELPIYQPYRRAAKCNISYLQNKFLEDLKRALKEDNAKFPEYGSLKLAELYEPEQICELLQLACQFMVERYPRLVLEGGEQRDYLYTIRGYCYGADSLSENDQLTTLRALFRSYYQIFSYIILGTKNESIFKRSILLEPVFEDLRLNKNKLSALLFTGLSFDYLIQVGVGDKAATFLSNFLKFIKEKNENETRCEIIIGIKDVFLRCFKNNLDRRFTMEQLRQRWLDVTKSAFYLTLLNELDEEQKQDFKKELHETLDVAINQIIKTSASTYWESYFGNEENAFIAWNGAVYPSFVEDETIKTIDNFLEKKFRRYTGEPSFELLLQELNELNKTVEANGLALDKAEAAYLNYFAGVKVENIQSEDLRRSFVYERAIAARNWLDAKRVFDRFYQIARAYSLLLNKKESKAYKAFMAVFNQHLELERQNKNRVQACASPSSSQSAEENSNLPTGLSEFARKNQLGELLVLPELQCDFEDALKEFQRGLFVALIENNLNEGNVLGDDEQFSLLDANDVKEIIVNYVKNKVGVDSENYWKLLRLLKGEKKEIFGRIPSVDISVLLEKIKKEVARNQNLFKEEKTLYESLQRLFQSVNLKSGSKIVFLKYQELEQLKIFFDVFPGKKYKELVKLLEQCYVRKSPDSARHFYIKILKNSISNDKAFNMDQKFYEKYKNAVQGIEQVSETWKAVLLETTLIQLNEDFERLVECFYQKKDTELKEDIHVLLEKLIKNIERIGINAGRCYVAFLTNLITFFKGDDWQEESIKLQNMLVSVFRFWGHDHNLKLSTVNETIGALIGQCDSSDKRIVLLRESINLTEDERINISCETLLNALSAPDATDLKIFNQATINFLCFYVSPEQQEKILVSIIAARREYQNTHLLYPALLNQIQESLFSNRSYDLSTLIDNYLVSLLEQDRDWEPLDLRLVLTYATEKQRKTLEIYLIKRIREIPEENTQERRQYIEKYNVIYPKITSDFARMINSCSESLSGLVQPYEENACHDHVVYARLTQDLEENYPIKKLYCIAIGSDADREELKREGERIEKIKNNEGIFRKRLKQYSKLDFASSSSSNSLSEGEILELLSASSSESENLRDEVIECFKGLLDPEKFSKFFVFFETDSSSPPSLCSEISSLIRYCCLDAFKACFEKDFTAPCFDMETARRMEACFYVLFSVFDLKEIKGFLEKLEKTDFLQRNLQIVQCLFQARKEYSVKTKEKMREVCQGFAVFKQDQKIEKIEFRPLGEYAIFLEKFNKFKKEESMLQTIFLPEKIEKFEDLRCLYRCLLPCVSLLNSSKTSVSVGFFAQRLQQIKQKIMSDPVAELLKEISFFWDGVLKSYPMFEEAGLRLPNEIKEKNEKDERVDKNIYLLNNSAVVVPSAGPSQAPRQVVNRAYRLRPTHT